MQGEQHRSYWLILILPLLFTAGMCLIDTIDGALMLSLYTAGIGDARETGPPSPPSKSEHAQTVYERRCDEEKHEQSGRECSRAQPHKPDALTLLYYNVVLTVLTVIVALVIGVIQIFGLVDSVASPSGQFWDGVRNVEDKFDIVGGAICGTFLIVGISSVALHKRWRKWVLHSDGEVENASAA